jgi:hypothetical protein
MAGFNRAFLQTFDETNSTDTGIISKNRTLYSASLGTFTPAELAGKLVYWDDISQDSSYERTWFDSFSLRRTDDDEIFYVEATDANSVAEDNPGGPWYAANDDDQAPLWNRRANYGTFGAVMQALKSKGDHYKITTTLEDPAPAVPETPVTLAEADTGAVTGGADFTESDLLSDYIVAGNGDTDTSGLDLLVEALTPGQDYYVKLWAFDDAANESTRSNWYANGALVNDGYRFDPGQDPMTNLEYSFGFLVTADENGEILIEGRVGADGAEDVGDSNVYLNALQVFEVTPTTPIPGDTNGDNVVDKEDAQMLATNWGRTDVTRGCLDGDFNDDGSVNVLDAAILAANWGDHTGGESHAAVPEPSTLVALLAALACLVFFQRTGR